MEPISHLHDSTIAALDLPLEEKISWLKRPRWIGYPRAVSILRKLDDLVVHPRQTRMPNMALIGSSNNGKSSIAEIFLEKYPPNENIGGDNIICPVLRIEAPPGPNESAFYSEILRAFFKKVPTASVNAQRDAVVECLERVGLKVLVVDEMHNMLAGTSVKQQNYLNVFKYLTNRLKISIVGIGTADLLQALSVDPQMQNRFPPEMLVKWTLDREARQLLKSFEMILPLKEPSLLHDKANAGKILAMSEGSIGEICTLLHLAAEHALRSKKEAITTDVLNKCGYVSPSERAQFAARL